MDRKPLIAIVMAMVIVSALVLIAGVHVARFVQPPWSGWSENTVTIGSDDEFTSSAAFVSGSGSESDPFVLSVSKIDFSHGVGMSISNTSAHFVLKDSSIRFHDPYADCIVITGVGVRIVNSSNFVVSNISLSGCDLEMKYCSAFEVYGFPLSYHVARFCNCTEGRVAGISTGELLFSNCTTFVVRDNLNTTIVLRDCNLTDISGNIITRSGITMSGCFGCRAFCNEIRYISADRGTTDSRISNNLLRNGTALFGAIYLDTVENITVDGNVIENCTSAGIQLVYNAVNCTIVNNDISGCYGGISLREANGCVVYHNNILSSRWSGGYIIGEQTDFDPPYDDYHGGGVLDEQGWLNAWHGGYPIGGNYYFDYNGTDLYGGPDQNVPGADGFGDTPLVIYTYLPGSPGIDRYPLMVPFPH